MQTYDVDVQSKTIHKQYKMELVLVLVRLLWYTTKMRLVRKVTQQAQNCPSKALQVRRSRDIKAYRLCKADRSTITECNSLH